jgi:hypothetical protein
MERFVKQQDALAEFKRVWGKEPNRKLARRGPVADGTAVLLIPKEKGMTGKLLLAMPPEA